MALIVASIWYENFPRTIVEPFAAGLPVIASRIGALAELVSEGETGLLFEPGNAQDLANKMAWALAHPNGYCSSVTLDDEPILPVSLSLTLSRKREKGQT